MLTKHEREVLDVIEGHYAKYGEAPSPKDVSNALGYKSQGTWGRSVTQLVSYGFLERERIGNTYKIHLISKNPDFEPRDVKKIPNLTESQKRAWLRDILGAEL